jgi:hypothetical protein
MSSACWGSVSGFESPPERAISFETGSWNRFQKLSAVANERISSNMP